MPAELAGRGAYSHAPRTLAVERTEQPRGLRLAGEVDVSNVALVEQALDENRSLDDSLHLDLTELLFCDVSGIRAIVSFAQGLERDRRVLLHGLPARIEKVMNLVGWSELAGLEFCSCDARR